MLGNTHLLVCSLLIKIKRSYCTLPSVEAKELFVDRVNFNYVLVDALLSFNHDLGVNFSQFNLFIRHSTVD